MFLNEYFKLEPRLERGYLKLNSKSFHTYFGKKRNFQNSTT